MGTEDCNRCRIGEDEVSLLVEHKRMKDDIDDIKEVIISIHDMGTDIKLMRQALENEQKVLSESFEKRDKALERVDARITKLEGWLTWFNRVIIGKVILIVLGASLYIGGK